MIADGELLQQRAEQLGLPFHLSPWQPGNPAAAAGRLYHQPCPLNIPVVPSQLNPAHATTILASLRQAATGCMQGDYAAMVTAPVHKGNINDAGIPFSGHTEYLATVTGGHPVMMLACPGLRVALVTTCLLYTSPSPRDRG